MKEVLILEQQDGDREKLKKIIGGIRDEMQCHWATSVYEAYHVMMQRNIDLFVIEPMETREGKGTLAGFRLIEQLRQLKKYRFTPIILLTRLADPDNYAVNTLHCFGYLEKPYQQKRLLRMIQEALELPKISDGVEHIYFRQNGILCVLKVREILYIQNRKKVLEVFTKEGSYELRNETAESFLNKIGRNRFLQCSRFTIVNIDYIEWIDFANCYLTVVGGVQLEIGRTMKKSFREELEKSRKILWF
ncbi:MAG: LytTR family DNA-binding domain-containing protein [Eubacterium sp.]|nr:LytTR family DNA-binding domain-containing protein [Eubacterium sp.]